MQPKVSIVVPSYNHAPYIGQCVESVLAQTVPDWEMIVVDDRSSDDSLEIWKSYSDPRIKVFRNEHNLGTYGNQNRGVELSSADLIAILDSDDFWAENKLELQLKELANQPDSPLCYTLGWRAPNDNLFEHNDDNHGDWPRTAAQELVPKLLEGNHVLASSVVFRRQWAKFDSSLRYSGDWIALLRAAMHSPVACVPENLSYWRIHSSNTFVRTAGATHEEIRVRHELLERTNQWLSGRWPVEEIHKGIGTCALHLAALYVLWGDMHMARKAASLAREHHPNKRAAFRRWAVCKLPLKVAFRQLWHDVAEPFEDEKIEVLDPISLD